MIPADVHLKVESFVSTEFDEAQWRERWEKAGLNDILASADTRNVLFNPTIQLAKPPIGFEDKPFMIFLIVPYDGIDSTYEKVPRSEQ